MYVGIVCNPVQLVRLDLYILPNTLRPLVTDNETTTTLNTKKTSPRRVVRIRHHFRFRFALAIVRPKCSARVTSSVKSGASLKTLMAEGRFQSVPFKDAVVPSLDEPISLPSNCWNNEHNRVVHVDSHSIQIQFSISHVPMVQRVCCINSRHGESLDKER